MKNLDKIEFYPDPEGKSINAAFNLAGVDGALDRLASADKRLTEALKKNRQGLIERAERELDDAEDRVNWWNH